MVKFKESGIVGSNGKVVGIDIQEKMLRSLKKRALKAGVADRIITQLGDRNSLGLNEFENRFDFGLAFAVVHEVPHGSAFFGELWKAMKSHGRCLVAEPKGRVSEEEFEVTLSMVKDKGFLVVARPKIIWSRSALIAKR